MGICKFQLFFLKLDNDEIVFLIVLRLFDGYLFSKVYYYFVLASQFAVIFKIYKNLILVLVSVGQFNDLTVNFNIQMLL